MALNSNNFDITLDQYASFNMTLQITDSASVPVPITSWSFSGSIKTNYNQPDYITTFSIAIIDASQSLVMIALPPRETGLLKRPEYVYDIIATNVSPNPDEVYRILEGKILPQFGVTESDII